MSDYQKNVHVFCLDDKGHAIERYLKKQGLPVPAAYICDEIGFYIAAHEEAGMQFDTECQQIDYGMGLVLLLQKQGGRWEIIAVITHTAIAYVATWAWKRIVRGVRMMLRKVVSVWRMVPRWLMRLTPEYA